MGPGRRAHWTPALLAVLLAARLGAGAQHGVQCGIVMVHAGEREGLVYVPPAVCYGIEPKALVIAAHGYGKNQWLEVEKWAPIAEEFNVAVLAPAGYRRSFNVGHCCGEAKDTEQDDIKVLEILTEEALKMVYPVVDWSKVVMTGFSNGGALTTLMVTNSTKRPTGISPIATFISYIPPEEVVIPPTSVWIHHGTMDDIVPHTGCCEESPCCCGIPKFEKCEGVAHHFQFWLRTNGCDSLAYTPFPHVPESECYMGLLCAKETRLCLYHGMDHEDLSHALPLQAENLAMLLRATGN